tara:strand:+ start:577 stop:807 length:231 start_codon:yes stop_codon:yes gene_type:complete
MGGDLGVGYTLAVDLPKEPYQESIHRFLVGYKLSNSTEMKHQDVYAHTYELAKQFINELHTGQPVVKSITYIERWG